MSKRLSRLSVDDLHGRDLIAAGISSTDTHNHKLRHAPPSSTHLKNTPGMPSTPWLVMCPCESRVGALPSRRSRSYCVTEYWWDGMSSPER
jgi:hypothetical protein